MKSNYQFKSKNGKITFEIAPLTQSDFDTTVILVTSAFIARDPLIVTLKIDFDSLHELTKQSCQRSIDDKLGVICRDVDTGKIVGAALNNDSYNMNIQPFDFSKIKKPLANLLEFLHSFKIENTEEFHPTTQNEIIYLFLLGVDSAYKNMGIGKELLKYCRERHEIISKARIYYCHCTSSVTAKLTKSLGWVHREIKDPKMYQDADKQLLFMELDKVVADLDLPKYEGTIIAVI